jgi:hypothetical protein
MDIPALKYSAFGQKNEMFAVPYLRMFQLLALETWTLSPLEGSKDKARIYCHDSSWILVACCIFWEKPQRCPSFVDSRDELVIGYPGEIRARVVSRVSEGAMDNKGGPVDRREFGQWLKLPV